MTSPNKPCVLIVEDEQEITKFLKATLTAHDYKPIFAESGKQGIRLVALYKPDIIILDLGLPDMDGLEVIKAVRQDGVAPIIVLSARGQEQDKVNALELGADDYLTKPFSTAELLARLKAALRRVSQNIGAGSAVFESQDLSVDLEKRLVLVKNDEIHLTPTEYKLLVILIKHADKVVTHAQLLKEVWGRHTNEDNHQLRMQVQRLRQKLDDDPMHPRHIMTEAGVGYRLRQL
ncbi:MAG: response regulator transcription factor [Alphaproteobacteria bacterium]|nr:response regulator transcription factor [Alphaproteobacteria bacterium]